MTMTAERLAELDAVMARVQPILQRMTDTLNDPVRDSAALLHLNNYALDAVAIALASIPDLRAHIDAQAATIARQAEALQVIVDDYQASPEHHPNDILIPIASFGLACAALTGAASE